MQSEHDAVPFWEAYPARIGHVNVEKLPASAADIHFVAPCSDFSVNNEVTHLVPQWCFGSCRHRPHGCTVMRGALLHKTVHVAVSSFVPLGSSRCLTLQTLKALLPRIGYQRQ